MVQQDSDAGELEQAIKEGASWYSTASKTFSSASCLRCSSQKPRDNLQLACNIPSGSCYQEECART